MRALRAVAAIALILVCAGAGRRKRQALEAELEAVRELARETRALSDMLELRPESLERMLSRLESPVWARLTELVGGGARARDVWEEALLADERLDKAARKAFMQVGGALSLGEREAQRAMLELTLREADSLAEAKARECERKGKMYSSLGVLTGLSLALLVI